MKTTVNSIRLIGATLMCLGAFPFHATAMFDRAELTPENAEKFGVSVTLETSKNGLVVCEIHLSYREHVKVDRIHFQLEVKEREKKVLLVPLRVFEIPEEARLKAGMLIDPTWLAAAVVSISDIESFEYTLRLDRWTGEVPPPVPSPSHEDQES